MLRRREMLSRAVAKALPFFRSAISCLTAVTFAIVQMGAPQAASALTRAEYEACQAGDEHGFRQAIEALTLKSLESGLANLDYRAIVADEWRRGGIDEVIDRQVDQAIGQVRDESSWLQLWSSLASRERAQELATTAAERVYRSDAIKKAIEQLATGAGKEIGKRIELAVLDTAGPATHCMRAFLGRRYGTTVAAIVSTDAGKEYSIDPAKAGARITPGQVLMEGSGGIAGAVVLVVRRQLSNMAARIGQRIVGSILSRLVSVAAGGVGLVLIAKDVWDFRHGVLPIIAGEMKSRAAKDRVRDEIASTISEHIKDSLKDIADKTAERVVEIWLEFRRAHAKVLELAGSSEPFKRFLDTLRPADLPRLDEIVAIVLAGEGEPGVTKRLADGTLNQAVSSLPPAALDIAREARSLEAALKWAAVAGESLPKVVDLEIHRRGAPEAFTKAGLQRLIALEDRLAVTRLASLQPTARQSLFELDGASLVRLARNLDEPQLESLSRYMTGLEKGPAQRILSAVSQTPARMADLSTSRVREAIIASRDQAAAVSMMLQGASIPDPGVVIAHTRLVLEGRVSPVLLWDKHGYVLAAAAVLALILLLMLKRLVFGTRPRVVVHMPNGRGR
jgi:hypothetical protein